MTSLQLYRLLKQKFPNVLISVVEPLIPQGNPYVIIQDSFGVDKFEAETLEKVALLVE
jgi:hypothetical protein